MTNEKFMENVKFLHSLKLRGSWGKLGNQEIGNYAYAATLAASGSYYFGDSKQIGMKTAKIPNENIKWETTTITDFGFDAAFGVERSMSLLTGMRKYLGYFDETRYAGYFPGIFGCSLSECGKGP